MAKITYVSLDRNGRKPVHMTLDRLAEICGSTPGKVRKDLENRLGKTMWAYGIPFAEGIQCPFGERDLMNDTCYIGSGEHKCPYFMQYVHDGEHKGTIKCCCPKPRVIAEKGKPIQLNLFDLL